MIDRVQLVKDVATFSHNRAAEKHGPLTRPIVEAGVQVAYLENALIKALNKLSDEEVEQVMGFLRIEERRAA